MSDAIRVGLVGFGYASKTFHAPLIGGTPGMALRAVASSDADKVHADWPGAQSTDYFHAVLAYPQRRVVLHGTLLAAAESARFIVHGSRASYIKYGLDPQEERLKNGERLPQEDWGYDMRDGTLTRAEGDERSQEKWLTLPGNYPAYYAAIRDALNGVGENPVSASEAIQIMTLIELGIESARHRATLSLV